MADLFTLTVAPPLSRGIYLKTAGILVVILFVIHRSGQWYSPPLIDSQLSICLCTGLGLLLLYSLTRTPFTRSLSLNYDSRTVLVTYMTLTKAENTLNIPFDQLTLKTDTSFGVKAYGTTWRIYLLHNQQRVYDLSNNENGFTEQEMNEFLDKLNACVNG
jgi:hypothetical protein